MHDELIERAGTDWHRGLPWVDALSLAAGAGMAVWVDEDGDVIEVQRVDAVEVPSETG
jgi:hypothetical protein